MTHGDAVSSMTDIRNRTTRKIGKMASSSVIRHRPCSASPIHEVAALLAQGYLRLLAAGRQRPELAPILAGRKSATHSPNCLDVTGPAKHELGRGVRP